MRFFIELQISHESRQLPFFFCCCLLLLVCPCLLLGGCGLLYVLEGRLASKFWASALGVADHTTFPAGALDPFAGSLGGLALAWLSPEVAL